MKGKPITKKLVSGLTTLLVTMCFLFLVASLSVSGLMMLRQHHQQQQSAEVAQMSLDGAKAQFGSLLARTITVISASNSSLTIRGYLTPSDTTPSQITIYAANGRIDYNAIPASGSAPNYSYNPTSAKTYVLMLSATNKDSSIFNYFDTNSNVLIKPVVASQVRFVEFLPSYIDGNGVLDAPIADKIRVELKNLQK